MKNIHAFIWSMEIYNESQVQGTWRDIQVIFELSDELMKILGIPAKKENSMYTAYWVSGNRKIMKQLIPDEVIRDSCKIELSRSKKTTSIDSYTYIEGAFGFNVQEFLSYDKGNPDDRIFIVNEDTARDNNTYVDRSHLYSSSKTRSYEAGVKELQGDEVVLSNQAKLYIACLIGRELVWNGRKYKFKVLQYSSEEIKQEIQDLLSMQVSWIDTLCDYFNVPKDLSILELIREVLSTEPNDYE